MGVNGIAYNRREITERLIGWLKEGCCIFSRFGKTAVNLKRILSLTLSGRYVCTMELLERFKQTSPQFSEHPSARRGNRIKNLRFSGGRSISGVVAGAQVVRSRKTFEWKPRSESLPGPASRDHLSGPPGEEIGSGVDDGMHRWGE